MKRKREGYEHPSELHVTSTSPPAKQIPHVDKDFNEPFRKNIRKQGMGGRFRH